jgi:hypothetical protein
MMNTIMNVTIELVVFITSCHVFEKPKRGPVAAHRITVRRTSDVAKGLAQKALTLRANREKYSFISLSPSR